MRDIHKADYMNKQEFSPARAAAACYLTDRPVLYLPCPSKGFEVKST
jgi:hypothetical protein